MMCGVPVCYVSADCKCEPGFIYCSWPTIYIYLFFQTFLTNSHRWKADHGKTIFHSEETKPELDVERQRSDGVLYPLFLMIFERGERALARVLNVQGDRKGAPSKMWGGTCLRYTSHPLK